MALDRIKHKNFQQNKPNNINNSSSSNNNYNSTNNSKSKRCIVMPYVHGLHKSIKNICGKYGIQTHFKDSRTIKNLHLSPKDKDPIQHKSGILYWDDCDRLDYNDEYTGESARTFGERYKEPLKAPWPIHDHHIATGHIINMDDVSIIGREGNGFVQTIKEYINIRVNIPIFNRNIGKYNLPYTWDGHLANTPELQTKHQQVLPQHHQVHKTLLAPPRTPYISAEKNNFPQTRRSQSVCLVKACLDEVSNILFN